MDSRRTRISFAVFSLAVLLTAGTFSFHELEKWSYVDSFYFTGVTLTTIGYGDLAPKSELGKLFTVFFTFSALGIAFYCISVLAEGRTLIIEESIKLGKATSKVTSKATKAFRTNGFKNGKKRRIRLADEED
ncbi:potassium channel family protein [archaeon]|nr:potassium channel family protein [archaeon]